MARQNGDCRDLVKSRQRVDDIAIKLRNAAARAMCIGRQKQDVCAMPLSH